MKAISCFNISEITLETLSVAAAPDDADPHPLKGAEIFVTVPFVVNSDIEGNIKRTHGQVGEQNLFFPFFRAEHGGDHVYVPFQKLMPCVLPAALIQHFITHPADLGELLQKFDIETDIFSGPATGHVVPVLIIPHPDGNGVVV